MDDSLFLFVALAFLGAMLYYSSRKRKKAADELRASVVKGAYVMLTSGIFGKVTAVLDNRIEFETAPGNKMLVAMGAVRSIEEEPKIDKSPAKKTASTTKSTTESSKPATKPKAKSAPKTK